MTFSVRTATPADTPLIFQLICELAEFENLRDQVTCTEETLHASLFHDARGPEVLIAEEGDKVVGFVLFFHNFSTFLGKKGIYIEDLYIRAEYRSKGYGKALILKICELARARNCGRIEWWVLDWNEKAINFYKKIGAAPMTDWTVFRLDTPSIERLLLP